MKSGYGSFQCNLYYRNTLQHPDERIWRADLFYKLVIAHTECQAIVNMLIKFNTAMSVNCILYQELEILDAYS